MQKKTPNFQQHNIFLGMRRVIDYLLIPLEKTPSGHSAILFLSRYSEFQLLHDALFKIHKGIHLRGKFPSLPKTKYFNRFQDKVLEDRRLACLDLLNFAAEHPQLYNSQVFTEFFILEDENCEDLSEASSSSGKLRKTKTIWICTK